MSGPKRRGVLMICYHYLPANNGGVERSVKFARDLPAHGWEPIVVTTNKFGPGGGAWGERVVRSWQPRGRLFSRGVRGRAGETEWVVAASDGTNGSGRLGRLHRGLLDFVDHRILIPDNKIHWALCALPPTFRILRRGEAEVIYTTSPPNSSHILGLLLKRLSGKPWIMDLRDPWTFEPLVEWLQDGGARLSLERRLESGCFDLADIVVANTDASAERYRSLYPAHAGKIRVITNGFDAREMEEAAATAADGPLGEIADEVFVASSLGSFYQIKRENRCPEALLQAVRMLGERGRIDPRRFRLVLAGHISGATRRRIAELGLGELIAAPGMVPHTDALRIMVRSNLLLLVNLRERAEYSIHGKLYEYLAAGRWILGMVPPGPNRDLLLRAGHDLFASPLDAEEIAAAISEAMRRGERPPANTLLDLWRFERGRLSAQLAACLDEAAERI